MEPIRTLVLSGGGGRGAFHAGAFKYLMEANKTGVDTTHQAAWSPDIVVGTSIGAVNGAAIVQGLSAEELGQFWLSLRERDIEGLPPGMRWVARGIARRAFKQMIGVSLPQVPAQQATSPTPDKFWPPLPLLPRWLGEHTVGRWINLLDTGPLRQTLLTRMQFDEQKIAQSAKTLLIAATNVQTGERVIFSNRPIYRRSQGNARRDVIPGITVDRILASCSIPLIYPWTHDRETQAYYWDGAVVANTPLGAALDTVADRPVDIPMEIVVVLMTPWWKAGEQLPDQARALPESFGEAITWTLDWALLASFRERLRLIEAYNRFAEQERAENRSPLQYRQVKVLIIAPEKFFPVARIIDYDQQSAELIQLGYEAAQQAFHNSFSRNSTKNG
jgi:NTE family protein